MRGAVGSSSGDSLLDWETPSVDVQLGAVRLRCRFVHGRQANAHACEF